jgi:hypothetical protein
MLLEVTLATAYLSAQNQDLTADVISLLKPVFEKRTVLMIAED